MEGVTEKAFGALGQFPIIQASVAVVIIIVGVFMILKASKDRNHHAPDPMPQWLMMGPLHDMMKAVHDIAEESRKANETLKENRSILNACKSVLEMIRNESRLR